MLKNKWLLKSTLLLGLALYPLVDSPQVSAETDEEITEEVNAIQESFDEPVIDEPLIEEEVEEEIVETMVQEEEDLPAPAAAVPEQVSYEVVYAEKKDIVVEDIDTHNEFINRVAPQATTVAKNNNLYASVMIAQATLETGYGTSFLSQVPNHNLFGIKGNYNGQSVIVETTEYVNGEWIRVREAFKKYPTYQASFEDNALKLRNGVAWDPNYYRGTWRENTTSYRDATQWLTGRYATDPNYNTKLNNLIEHYKLTRFDDFAYLENPTIQLTLAPSYNPDRIYGDNRYSNAARISQSAYSRADHVFIANGDKFADALTGTPLAALHNAPLLLSYEDRLPEATLNEINRLAAGRITLLGGRASISQSVENYLRGLGLTVNRIGGANRYEQAALVAEEILRLKNVSRSDFFIASGDVFPDALSIASVAAAKKLPILLTREYFVPPVTLAFNNRAASYTIIGGEATISASAANTLGRNNVRVNRFSGSDRYAVNRRIIEHYGTPNDRLYVVSGDHFSDALPASVLAARTGGALLFVRNNHTVNLRLQLRFAVDRDIERLTLIGGPNTLSERTLYSARYAAYV